MDCTHCYHDTSAILASDPPYTEKRCCWCGETIHIRQVQWALQGKHGPYIPSGGLTPHAADASPQSVKPEHNTDAAKRG